MTRIEPAAGDRPVAQDDVKRIVRQELFLEIFRRKFFSCLGYLVVLLVVFGFPTGLALTFIAKTGFVEVPVLTGWLYEPAKPVRVVTPVSVASTDILLKNVGARARYEPLTNLLTLPIKESELTSLAIDSLKRAPAGTLPFAVKDLQVAVLPDKVEIFAVVPREKRDATLLVRLAPRVTDGTLNLELQELQLGDTHVPNALAQPIISSAAKLLTDALTKSLADSGRLADVVAEAGELRFVLSPKLP